MDKLETISNCSDSTDSPSSNTSNFSSLSDYKNNYFNFNDYTRHYKVTENAKSHDYSLDSGILSDTSDSSTYYETIINDLTEELVRSKKHIKEQEGTFEKINKENSDLLSKFVSLQKSLQQKEYYIEALETDKSNLKQKLINALDKKKSVADQLAQIKDIASNLQIDIIVKKEEGQTIENSLKLVQERFRLFKKKYESLKQELQKTTNENLQLRSEKQELFMSNNWKTCKLNNYTKLEKEIQHLQEKLLHMIHNENHLKFENAKLVNEVVKLKEENLQCAIPSKIDMKNANKKFCRRLTLLVERCENVKTKIEKTAQIADELKQFNNNERIFDEINLLRASLQVQIRKQKEQHKRYQKNYSIVLKNVKEAMHAKNAAEKQNSLIQKLHNSLSDKCNDLKTLLSKKDKEIDLLEHKISETDTSSSSYMYDDSLDCSIQYQRSISTSEKQDSEISDCQSCIQLAEVTKRLQDAEESLKQIMESQNSFKNQLLLKDAIIEQLKNENQKLKSNNFTISSQRDSQLSEIDMLNYHIEHLKNEQRTSDEQLQKVASKNKELILKLEEEKANYSELYAQNEQLAEKYKTNEDVIKSNYERQMADLQSNLQRKAEEIDELHKIKESSDRNWSMKASKFQNIIFTLKTQIRSLKNEVEATQNQKFFLQRLCTDLKVALKVHNNRNTILQQELKQQLSSFHTKKSILTLPEIPVPSNINDVFIETLLNKNAVSMKETSFSDIQDTLKALKDEMSDIQNHLKKCST